MTLITKVIFLVVSMMLAQAIPDPDTDESLFMLFKSYQGHIVGISVPTDYQLKEDSPNNGSVQVAEFTQTNDAINMIVDVGDLRGIPEPSPDFEIEETTTWLLQDLKIINTPKSYFNGQLKPGGEPQHECSIKSGQKVLTIHFNNLTGSYQEVPYQQICKSVIFFPN